MLTWEARTKETISPPVVRTRPIPTDARNLVYELLQPSETVHLSSVQSALHRRSSYAFHKKEVFKKIDVERNFWFISNV